MARRACRCARAALWLAILVHQRLRPNPFADQERLAGTVRLCNGDDRGHTPSASLALPASVFKCFETWDPMRTQFRLEVGV